MKTAQVTTFVLSILAGAALASTNVANTDNLTAFSKKSTMFFGEAPNALEARDCTNCVGSHGLCTIGEGNCYAPQGCYFCGDCGASKARCQDPDTEECQCYPE